MKREKVKNKGVVKMTGCLLLALFLSFLVATNCKALEKVTSKLDDHGDKASEATYINLNSITTGALHNLRDKDYFRVNLPIEGLLKIFTTGKMDTKGNLQYKDSNVAWDDNSGVDKNFLIYVYLEAGIYDVVVSGRRPIRNRSYNLVSEFLPAQMDEAEYLDVAVSSFRLAMESDGSKAMTEIQQMDKIKEGLEFLAYALGEEPKERDIPEIKDGAEDFFSDVKDGAVSLTDLASWLGSPGLQLTEDFTNFGKNNTDLEEYGGKVGLYSAASGYLWDGDIKKVKYDSGYDGTYKETSFDAIYSVPGGTLSVNGVGMEEGSIGASSWGKGSENENHSATDLNFELIDNQGNTITVKVTVEIECKSGTCGGTATVTTCIDGVCTTEVIIITIEDEGENGETDTGEDSGDDSGDDTGDDSGDDSGDDTGDDSGDDSGDDTGDDSGDGATNDTDSDSDTDTDDDSTPHPDDTTCDSLSCKKMEKDMAEADNLLAPPVQAPDKMTPIETLVDPGDPDGYTSNAREDVQVNSNMDERLNPYIIYTDEMQGPGHSEGGISNPGVVDTLPDPLPMQDSKDLLSSGSVGRKDMYGKKSPYSSFSR